jgi:hypothetical protein
MTTETPSGQITTESATQAGTDTGAAPSTEQTAQTLVTKSPEGATTEPAKQDPGKADDKGTQAKAGAPEKYQPFTVPEGVTLSEESVTELTGIAKELNLDQAQAQKVADLLAKTEEKYGEKQAIERLNEKGREWEQLVKSDKTLGGKKLDENLAVAKKAVDAFATPALRKMMEETRFGNHPEVVRLFHKVGQAMSEDKVLIGVRQSNSDKDLAKSLYPNQA